MVVGCTRFTPPSLDLIDHLTRRQGSVLQLKRI